MSLISVVIITYNRELPILKRAINSVRKQTYTNIELLIVNDAPENTSLAKQIKEFINGLNDNRVKYIQHTENKGANVARNTGLYAAKGDYIAFLDDDDEWLPEKLDTQLKYFTTPDIALVSCGFKIKKGDKTINHFPVAIQHNPLEQILKGNFIASTSFPLLRKAAVLQAGGFDEHLKSCQEHDLWIRLLNKHQMAVCPKLLGIYYLSKDSTFKSVNKFLAGFEYINKKHQKLFKQYPKLYHIRLLKMSFYLLSVREYKLALKYKLQAWKIDFWNFRNIFPLFIIEKLYIKWRNSLVAKEK